MKILLIEDDPEILHVEQTVLLDAGYDVESATDGADALNKLKSTPYDGIVLGLAGDGDRLAGQIETIDTNRRTPLIVIGSGRADDRKRAFDAGAAVFLNKPLTSEAFRSVVRSTLRPARPGVARVPGVRPAGISRPSSRRPAAATSSAPWPSREAVARQPREAPRPALIDPLAVRSQEGMLYWSEPDPDGGWRCGRCETGVITSAEVGIGCTVCHAEVVVFEERPRGSLGWLIVLVVLALLIGWSAFTWWS